MSAEQPALSKGEQRLGLKLSSLRNHRGWSGKVLGEKLGVSKGTVSQYETGSVIPNVEMLQNTRPCSSGATRPDRDC